MSSSLHIIQRYSERTWAQRARNVGCTISARSGDRARHVQPTCTERGGNVRYVAGPWDVRVGHVPCTYRARSVHVPCTFRSRSVHGPYTVRVLRMARSRKSFPRRKKSCGKSTFPKSHFPGAKESLGNGTFLKVIMLVARSVHVRRALSQKAIFQALWRVWGLTLS